MAAAAAATITSGGVNFRVGGKSQPQSPPCTSSSKLIFSSSTGNLCCSNNCCLSLRSSRQGALISTRVVPNPTMVIAAAKPEPLKIMISGAPASGKGTQCELITKKYGLVHIAAGDLLRMEIASGSENGKRAKEYMEKGQLVPNEIVVMMVKERLLQPDAQENGWLLDGYPRSLSQATAFMELNFQPDLFILLEVDEEILVERVVGRRLDPVTGRIYHLKYSPPETEEVAARLTQRFDDTEEKVKLRLQTHHENVEAVLSIYEDITLKVNGNISKEQVFAQIDNALTKLHEDRKAVSEPLAA
ncbi:adenylate kinase, chloroplastic isoform X2 [Ricinus communis]|uniref:adenylate kinase, chloroplastic isoform X2 n=1 Tax=Ricinus communis TaxID=3988 RepID=UPI00077257DE|nr:adenylate kinase, chloroplastic isoform X2 [Ricinus communis]|eukprot:XP_015576444.1 adenylate kinase, chloroplastic [Ricinus communis]